MLCEGVETRRSRRSAYIHRDRIHGMLRPRRGARLTAITNGGAIPDTADYNVVEFPDRDLRRHGERGFRHREFGRRYFSLGQSLLAHSARRFGQGLGRRRPRTAAEYSVLDGRGAGAHGGACPRRYPTCAARWRSGVADRTAAVAMACIGEVTMPPAAAEQIVNYVADTVRRARHRADAGVRSSPSVFSTKPAACS